MKEASIQNRIKDLAKDFGYELVFEKPANCLIRIQRDGVRIDVWYSKMTVGIQQLNHEGYFAKFDWEYLRDVSEETFVDILDKPKDFI